VQSSISAQKVHILISHVKIEFLGFFLTDGVDTVDNNTPVICAAGSVPAADGVSPEEKGVALAPLTRVRAVTTPNALYYGDNLAALRKHVDDESVDLIYLDPPFKSDQDYNILFKEQDGSRAAAQIQAFEDTWQWDSAAVHDYQEIAEGGGKVSETVQAFRLMLGGNDMLAYLTRMAPRLVELHRVLKPTGSLYLHCDPTASHYLKILLDAVFGPECFKNEIIWKRADPKGHAFSRFPSTHDVLLYYGVSANTSRTVLCQYIPNSRRLQYTLKVIPQEGIL
jgi:hypothetical protein